MILPPNQLFASYERVEIEREELHAMMALHARGLIHEMEEDRLNPAATLIENLLTRRAASRLRRKHGERLVREILTAIGELENFPSAAHLWNAAHPDVPLYCFFRIRKLPRFIIHSLAVSGGEVTAVVEHGSPTPIRESVHLKRNEFWKFALVQR